VVQDEQSVGTVTESPVTFEGTLSLERVRRVLPYGATSSANVRPPLMPSSRDDSESLRSSN